MVKSIHVFAALAVYICCAHRGCTAFGATPVACTTSIALVVAAFPPKNGRLFAIWIDTMSAWAPAFSPRSLGCALGTAAFMFFAALGTAAQVRLCHSAAPPVLAIVYEYETTNNHFRFRWERESSLPGSQDPKAEVCPRPWRYQAIPTRSHHSSKTFYS